MKNEGKGKKNTSKLAKRRKRRNALDDGRGILLEIQRDVNILLYIELARQSEKVFSSEARAAPSFSSALSEIPPFFIGARLAAGGKRGVKKTPGDNDTVINVIMKRD